MEVQASSPAMLAVQPISVTSMPTSPFKCTHSMPDVVPIIPAFDEERCIASVIIGSLQDVGRAIVVDDGASEMTAFPAESDGVQVIRQPKHIGKARALTTGYTVALESPRAIVCLDGNTQHRALDRPSITAPKWRQSGQLALTAVTNTSRLRVTDPRKGVHAFSPGTTQTLQFSSARLLVASELQFVLASTDQRLTEDSIEAHSTADNERFPVRHALQVVDSIISLMARRRPLLYLSIPGTLGAALGLKLGLGGLLFHTREVQMLVSVLIMGSLLMAVTGVMLQSVQNLAARLDVEFREAIRALALEGGRQRPSA